MLSANIAGVRIFETFVKSFIEGRNSKGPSIEPWRTPQSNLAKKKQFNSVLWCCLLESLLEKSQYCGTNKQTKKINENIPCHIFMEFTCMSDRYLSG